MRHYIPLTKGIDLRSLSDRRDLYKLLKSIREFDSQIVQIKKIIKLFVKYLSDEWLIFRPYPVDGVVLEIEDHKSVSLNFADDILPFGQSFLVLRRLRSFDRLIKKLNTRAHDRLSAVMEAIFSAKYKKAGYQLQLEPTTKLKRRPDFKVMVNGEWIFIECKAENYFESESFSRNNRFFLDITKKIKKGLSDFNNISIKIDSKRKLSNKDLALLTQRIKYEIQRNNFDNSAECYGIRFSISKVSSSTNTDIQISQLIYSGTAKDLGRLGRLLNSARDQLPSDKKGIIIIKANNKDIAIQIAREKIARNDYCHISAIAVIESGEGEVIINPHIERLPSDFMKLLLLKPLPCFWF